MSDLRKRRTRHRVLAAALGVPVVAVAGCGTDDGDAPTAPSSAPASSAASTTSTAASSDGADAIDIDLSGAPDGFEMTPPGTRLPLGETAQIFTQNDLGTLQFWEVTVSELRDAPADAIEIEEDIDVDHFVCVIYDMTLLGDTDDPGFTPDDADRPTDSDGEPISFTEGPDLIPVGVNGKDPNAIFSASPDYCGIDRDDTLPTKLADVEEGKLYHDSDVSFFSNGTGGAAGVDPVGARLYVSEELRERGVAGTVSWER